jgi:hypothetical protein
MAEKIAALNERVSHGFPETSATKGKIDVVCISSFL